MLLKLVEKACTHLEVSKMFGNETKQQEYILFLGVNPLFSLFRAQKRNYS